MRILFIIVLSVLGFTWAAQGQDVDAKIPHNLAVPAGNAVLMTLVGDGVQIYKCAENSKKAGTYEWAFVEPHADLWYTTNDRMGIHYAGPSWEANDGSTVRGEVVQRADSPDGAIPWLLLKAVSVSGNGLFTHVTYVQRLDTFMGAAPAAEYCSDQKIGQMARVPYRALYRFYTADPVDMSPTNVPTGLEVPAGNRVVYQVHAAGVQIYRCQESADVAGKFTWTFVAPEADLMNDLNARVGSHYAGPTWASNDGSWVSGAMQAKADSPNGAIPWLLLKSVSAQGNGVLGNVSFVQRLDTAGGTAPAADTCSTDHDLQLTRVPYSALYVFYAAG